jgi:hypothetical protein
LPEYRRAVRRRTVATIVAIVLLAAAFGASVLVASRPTGLPSAGERLETAQPEDIMVCIGAPATDRAVGASLRYLADRMKFFTTERVGLSSADRRLVPLTRDYQYAAAQFNAVASAPQRTTVSYADYAGDVADVLAMCLTGFPSFDKQTPQRRSLIYVGPASLREPGDPRPVLFTADSVRELAQTAHVQLNVVSVGPNRDALDALARSTGGRAAAGNTDAAGAISEIRRHPPGPTAAGQAAVVKTAETPDVPVIVALAALVGLLMWPLVMRR